MKMTSTAALVLITIVSPATLPAQTPTPSKTFEATKTVSGGSLNPPNPSEACKDAKQATIDKAASEGFKGAITWSKLTFDSDCKLTTTRVGTVGYYYTFTARGTFYQGGVQQSLEPQKDHKTKFKAGCLASGGSWIENADDSYQCNTRSGETNKCFKTTPPTPCVHQKL